MPSAPANAKRLLLPAFDPIWIEDFFDLRSLSKTAFILRQLYRLYRDPATNIVNLPDTTIRKFTGFGRNTIAKAKKELIAHGFLTPIGYHALTVKEFHKFYTGCSKTEQVVKNDLLQNRATGCSKTEHHLLQNGAPLAPKQDNPYKADSDTDITDRENFPLTEKDFDHAEIPFFKQFFPFRTKRSECIDHLKMRGFTEHAISELLEKVIYPEEYGYRKPS